MTGGQAAHTPLPTERGPLARQSVLLKTLLCPTPSPTGVEDPPSPPAPLSLVRERGAAPFSASNTVPEWKADPLARRQVGKGGGG